MFLATPTAETPQRQAAKGRSRRKSDDEEDIIISFDNVKVSFRESWGIAVGQTSTVCRGLIQYEDDKSGRECAVKIAHEDEDSVWAVDHEQKVLRVIGDCEHVMPLLIGKRGVSVFDLAPMSLVKAIETSKDVKQKLIWVKQLFRGLCEVHERGVVHGDLKLHNVLIDRCGRLRLCDFGNSYIISDNSDEISGGGTTAYTPPEALTNNVCSSDPFKRDVYAAGLTSYFMLTGRMPFKSHGSPVRLIVAIRQGFMECGDNGVPGDLYSQDPPFYDALIQFLRWCTHKDPRERPTAPQALEKLLKEFTF